MHGAKKLFKWGLKYKVLIIGILTLTILTPLTYSYTPQFIRYVFNEILPKTGNINIENSKINLPNFLIDFFKSFANPLKALLAVGGTLLIFQAFRGILMFLAGYLRGKFAENIAYDIRNKTYSHIQNLSYSYHNNVDTGDLIQRCTSDVDTIKSFLSAQLPQIFNILASFISGAVQMAFMNYKIMLVTLCVAPITITMSFIYYRFVKRKFNEIEKYESEMTTVLQENINGVRVVKAFAQEKNELDKFSEKSNKFRKADLEFMKGMALYWSSSDLLTMLQYVITMSVAIYFASKGELSSGDYIAYGMYIGMLVWPIRGLGRIIGDYGKAVVAAGRIDEILSVEDEYQADGTLTPEITGKIEFKDVYFKFPDTDNYLLKGVSFTIKPGETVAIIGKTGSGKSTIANLLVRMLEYEKGHILIDGVELKDINKHHVRKHIGIILQDPFLYAKTIYENISIANCSLSEEDVYRAAQVAAIHDDILSFDKGYQTLVGEKGVTLSGGQKQRIAIARMLVLNKPIMIFDDSLSAVDTKTDYNIRKALKEKNRGLTSIIITHRIATAKEADKIIVLEDGKVSAIGTHEELSKQEGLYKSLWDIQGNLEEEFMTMIKEERQQYGRI